MSKTILSKHNCKTCKVALQRDACYVEDPSELLTSFKAYDNDLTDFGSLVVPTDNFVTNISLCEKVFIEYFNNYLCIQNIREKIKGWGRGKIQGRMRVTLHRLGKSFNLCDTSIEDVLISLFVRLQLLYYAVKFYNRTLEDEKRNTSKSRKLVKVSHL